MIISKHKQGDNKKEKWLLPRLALMTHHVHSLIFTAMCSANNTLTQFHDRTIKEKSRPSYLSFSLFREYICLSDLATIIP